MLTGDFFFYNKRTAPPLYPKSLPLSLLCRLVLVLACLAPACSTHAQNMVANPSFSDINICTEYSYPCAPSAWLSVAPNVGKLMYTAEERSKNRLITLTMHSSINPLFRTYAQTQLLCPLRKGQAYRVKIYAWSGASPFPYPGIAFDTAFVYRWSATPLQIPAALHFTKEDEQGKKDKWTILEKTFVAPADAGYMIIGNFDTTLAERKGKTEYYLSVDSMAITPLSGKLCEDAKTMTAKIYALHDRHHYLLEDRPVDTGLHPVKIKRIALKKTVFYTKGACDTLLLKSDFFLPNSKHINPAYQAQLEGALRKKGNELRTKIRLTGYVFKNSSGKFNEIMAQDRAQAVASYLVYEKGFSFDDFIISGVGEPPPMGDSSEMVSFISCQPAEEITVPVTRTDTLLIPDLLFAVDSHLLNRHMLNALDSLVGKIPVNDSISITVTGHTDNTGTSEHNQELSMRRAFTVANYILDKKPRSNITTVTGMGESIPAADNSTAAGRQKNRRVEIVIYHLSL